MFKQIHALQDALRKAYSNWDYFKFCQKMGLNHHYDQRYWDDFQRLVKAVCAWDAETLTRLLNAAGPDLFEQTNPDALTLSITGHSNEPNYPLTELIAAIEEALDDLERFTTPLNGDLPEPFEETYHTDAGELTVKLTVPQQESSHV